MFFTRKPSITPDQAAAASRQPRTGARRRPPSIRGRARSHTRSHQHPAGTASRPLARARPRPPDCVPVPLRRPQLARDRHRHQGRIRRRQRARRDDRVASCRPAVDTLEGTARDGCSRHTVRAWDRPEPRDAGRRRLGPGGARARLRPRPERPPGDHGLAGRRHGRRGRRRPQPRTRRASLLAPRRSRSSPRHSPA